MRLAGLRPFFPGQVDVREAEVGFGLDLRVAFAEVSQTDTFNEAIASFAGGGQRLLEMGDGLVGLPQVEVDVAEVASIEAALTSHAPSMRSRKGGSTLHGAWNLRMGMRLSRFARTGERCDQCRA